MSEIKIVIDSYSEADSLKSTNGELEKMLSHLKEIARVKGGKAKNSNNVTSIANETAELKKLEKQTEAVKKEVSKLANEEKKLAAAEQKRTEQLVHQNKVDEQRIETARELAAIRVDEKRKLAEIKLQTDAEVRARKEAEKAARKQTGAYAELSRKHRELVKEAKDLAVQYGIESAQAKKATEAANKLDVQLKKIDASLGQHQRNVGNYSSAFTGLNNVLGQFGIALSVGAVYTGLKASVESFVEAEKTANALEFAIKNVAEEGEVAFQKLIRQSEELQESGGVFSDDQIQQAQTQLLNYGLLSDEVEELMPKILDLATAQGVDLATATDTVIKGINGQTKGLKTVGLGFDDTGSRADNYAIILEKLNKFQGAAADAATTTEGKYLVLMNRIDDLKEDIGEFLVNAGSGWLDFWDVLTGKVELATIQINMLRDALVFDEATDAFLANLSNFTEAEQRKLLIEQTKKYQDQLALLDFQYKQGKISIDQYTAAQKELTEQQQRLFDVFNSLPSVSGKGKTFDGRTGDGDDDGEKDKQKKRVKSQRETEYDIYNAKRNRRYKERELEKEEAKDRDQKLLDDIEARRKENEEIKEAQEEMDFWLWKQQKEENKKLEEERQRHHDQVISQVEAFGNKLIDAATERAQRELGVVRDQITKQNDMVDIQRQRAANGMENTLAFEERKRAEMERNAIRQEEKIRKIKQSEAYWELLAAFARSDGDEAAQKAALEIAEGIAISALFAEKGGMGEDLKESTTLTSEGWNKTHGSGDMLTMISPKEGILTEQNIAALGGKEGFYELKYNLERMGSNPISDDIFEKQNSSFMNVQLQKTELDTSGIEQKLERLTEIMENKPVPSSSIDGLGNYLHTIDKKNSRVTTDKGRFINPRRIKFIN